MPSARLKTAVRSVVGRTLTASPHFWRALSGRALILMYHRVLPKHETAVGFVQAGMYVTPATFQCHLQWLTQHFQVVTLRSLVEKWDRGDWDDSARYCAITFDDGWVDNYRYAYPLLRAYGAPATIFLPTALTGTREWLWSDRLGYLLTVAAVEGRSASRRCRCRRSSARNDAARAARRADRRSCAHIARQVPDERCFLDWSEVGRWRMAESTSPRIPPAMRCCRRSMPTRCTGNCGSHSMCSRGNSTPLRRLLAYPNGDHSAAVVDAARRAGYAAAVTTQPGVESRVAVRSPAAEKSRGARGRRAHHPALHVPHRAAGGVREVAAVTVALGLHLRSHAAAAGRAGSVPVALRVRSAVAGRRQAASVGRSQPHAGPHPGPR